MSVLLEMMPTNMMPTGWDWGSMWLVMLVPGLAVVAAIVIIVLLVLRQERQPNPVSPMAYFSPQPTMSTPLKNDVSTRPETPKLSNDVIGKVVLSLASTLTDDERRVMDELAKAGGEMLQSDLPQMTGYSKATVSKAIHSLEVRGIILRETHKWTYWCRVNPRLIERVQAAPTG